MDSTDTPLMENDRISWGGLLAVMGFVVLVSVFAAAAPRSGAPVAVFMAPWQDDRSVFDRVIGADHVPVAFGVMPGSIIVANAGTVPLRSLRAAGAWFMIDASFAAVLCLKK